MAGHRGHSLNRAAGTVWHGAGAISVLTVMIWVLGAACFSEMNSLLTLRLCATYKSWGADLLFLGDLSCKEEWRNSKRPSVCVVS